MLARSCAAAALVVAGLDLGSLAGRGRSCWPLGLFSPLATRLACVVEAADVGADLSCCCALGGLCLPGLGYGVGAIAWRASCVAFLCFRHFVHSWSRRRLASMSWWRWLPRRSGLGACFLACLCCCRCRSALLSLLGWLAWLGRAGLPAVRSSPSVPPVGGRLPHAAVRLHVAVVLGAAGVVRVHAFKAQWLPSAPAWACRAVSLLGVGWCCRHAPRRRCLLPG